MSISTFNVDGFIEYLQSLAGGINPTVLQKQLQLTFQHFFSQQIIHQLANTMPSYLTPTTSTAICKIHSKHNLKTEKYTIDYTEVTENSITIDQGLTGRCQSYQSVGGEVG